jgi:hypothetical protein
MSDIVCENCSAVLPPGARRCAHCGKRRGGKGAGRIVLLLASLAVGALLAQDFMNRSASWIRKPLARSAAAVADGGRPPAADPLRGREPAARIRRAHRHKDSVAVHDVAANPETTLAAKASPLPVAGEQEVSGDVDRAVPSAPAAQMSEAERWADEFRAPPLGSEVTVQMRSGSPMTGRLVALNENVLELESAKMKVGLIPEQLNGRTRVRFFLADYLRYRQYLAKQQALYGEPAASTAAATQTEPRDVRSPSAAKKSAGATAPESAPMEAGRAADAFFKAFDD